MEHPTSLRVIITGASGMVGEGVVQECLLRPEVEAILLLSRKPSGIQHPKVKEVLHPDFFDLSPVADQLTGYNACFFCLGVSSVGMPKDEYYAKTYTLTLHVAGILAERNPGMTFCYISGVGTDRSEKGRSNWARVKGKTENDLAKLPFKRVFGMRPGFLKAAPGAKNTPRIYNWFAWLYPVLRTLFPSTASTLAELARAMIFISLYGFERDVVEVKDIVRLAKSR